MFFVFAFHMHVLLCFELLQNSALKYFKMVVVAQPNMENFNSINTFANHLVWVFFNLLVTGKIERREKERIQHFSSGTSSKQKDKEGSASCYV